MTNQNTGTYKGSTVRRLVVATGVALLLAAVQLHAAVAFTSAVTGVWTTGTATDATGSMTVTAGDFLVACIGWHPTGVSLHTTVTSTASSNLTCGTRQDIAGGQGAIRLCTHTSPTAGAQTFVANFDASPTRAGMVVMNFTGAASFGTQVSATGASGSPATGAIATATDDMTAACATAIHNLTADQTARGEAQDAARWTNAQTGNHASSVSHTWMQDAPDEDWGAIGINIVATGGAGPTCRGALRLLGVGGC